GAAPPEAGTARTAAYQPGGTPPAQQHQLPGSPPPAPAGHAGPGPLPPADGGRSHSAQQPGYGTHGGGQAYGAAPQQPAASPEGATQYIPPVGHGASPEGATQYIPPVGHGASPEGATQYIPPVTGNATDEGATQYIPPVAAGGLPPERPAGEDSEETRSLRRPQPPAGDADAEATQYIP